MPVKVFRKITNIINQNEIRLDCRTDIEQLVDIPDPINIT